MEQNTGGRRRTNADHHCRIGRLFAGSLQQGGIDQSLFMKLVEEIGEVANVLNKKAGRKAAGEEDLQAQLGKELADVIHYTVAIAALNGLDLNEFIIEKDKVASVKYHHATNLEQFVLRKRSTETKL